MNLKHDYHAKKISVSITNKYPTATSQHNPRDIFMQYHANQGHPERSKFIKDYVNKHQSTVNYSYLPQYIDHNKAQKDLLKKVNV